MIKEEWLNIFKTKKMLVAIIAILFIPVLYSGMFLWAFWDPYANLQDLPVAIVNEDKGATLDGEELYLGKELTEKLVDSQQFKFVEVGAKDAEKQLKEQNYYILIKIPDNFSSHATTLLDEHPEKLAIEYLPNEGFNFLGAQIGDTALERIKAEVNNQVSKTYAKTLFTSINKLGDGFTQAADGANLLDNGAQKLADGAHDLEGYLQQLAASTITLSDGTNTLTNGMQEANSGATQLAQGLTSLLDGTNKLSEGANTAASGATNLQQGITDYTNGVSQIAQGQQAILDNQKTLAENLEKLANGTNGLDDHLSTLANGSKNIADGLEQLKQSLQPIMTTLPPDSQMQLEQLLNQLLDGSKSVNSGLDKIATNTVGIDDNINQLSQGATALTAAQSKVVEGIEKLVTNSPALTTGATQLAQGNQTLASSMQQLLQGTTSAATGANNLVAGLDQLADGSTKLSDGTTLLHEKSQELAQGSTTLSTGTNDLVEGTTELANKLTEAKDEVDINVTDENYEMLATPVTVEKTAINHVPNYGSGFAPYFISLGLFVGALVVSVVFPLVDPVIKPTNGFKWFLSKASVLAVIGSIQSIITAIIVINVLGLEVHNLGLFIGTCFITSFTFLAMIQFLVSFMGDAGRFVAIVILILQLTTSAGTFPLELVPSQLHVFNTLLPMTYSVSAFKAAISTGDTSFLFYNWSVLSIYLVPCLLLSLGYFSLIFKRRYSKQDEQVLN